MHNFMVILVLDDPEYTEEIMAAWEKAGVSGITVFHSSGLGRARRGINMDDLPIFPSLESLDQALESYNRTMFTVVHDQEMVDRIVEATQSVIGDLSNPNTGILFVMPVLQAYGLNKVYR